jgi:hypothetical protein
VRGEEKTNKERGADAGKGSDELATAKPKRVKREDNREEPPKQNKETFPLSDGDATSSPAPNLIINPSMHPSRIINTLPAAGRNVAFCKPVVILKPGRGSQLAGTTPRSSSPLHQEAAIPSNNAAYDAKRFATKLRDAPASIRFVTTWHPGGGGGGGIGRSQRSCRCCRPWSLTTLFLPMRASATIWDARVSAAMSS